MSINIGVRVDHHEIDQIMTRVVSYVEGKEN
jgi:hypothetical protein